MKDLNYPVLVNLGFEPKEARIYLALLKLGQGTVLAISRRSKVNRASIYYIISQMEKQGLVTRFEKRGTDYFAPVDPDLLLARKKKKLREFEAAIPELKSLINESGQRPRVRFFEGIEGVKALYADTLTAKTEMLNYANSRQIRDYWPEYDADYVSQRVRRGIFLRGIAPDDEYGKRVHSDDKNCLRKIRLVDPRRLNFQNEIKIYDNKIAMVSFGKDIYGIIIESRPLTDTQRAIFEMAWSFARSHH